MGNLAIGVGAIAAGVALDLIPQASSNGEVDPGDFVPVALYGIGAAFVYAGVF